MRTGMIHLAATALALAAAPQASNAAPMQRCDLRTQAWCLLQAGIYFDVRTVDNERRVWTLRGPFLGAEQIRIVEKRGCSSYPSDVQLRSEGPGCSALDGSSKHLISWTLHKDNSCTLVIEIPATNGVRNVPAYELALSALKACTDERCAGPSLAATPSAGAARRR